MWAIREIVPGDASAGMWLEWNPALQIYMTTGTSKHATKFATEGEAKMTIDLFLSTWDRPLEVREVQP